MKYLRFLTLFSLFLLCFPYPIFAVDNVDINYFDNSIHDENFMEDEDMDETLELLNFEEVLEIDHSFVRLNEVMPNPDGSDTDYEWLELYNDSLEEIDLTGCTIDSKEFPEGTIIEAESFLVIAKDLLDKDEDGQSFEIRWGDGSNVWGDSEIEEFITIEMTVSMKNSDDSIEFICNEHVDSFSWEEAISGQSFSKDMDGEWTNEYLITPGYANEAKPVIVYSHNILIAEVYPSPLSGEGEWIELYNFSNEEINLESWILEDNTKQQILPEPLVIEPNSYLVLDSEILQITLNNSGETLTLYDPNEEVVDVFEYSSTAKGISNIREWANNNYSDEIFQTQVITKGEQNESVDPNDVFYGLDILSIKEARNMNIGDEVCIKGIITVEMNVLGKKLFYIQDETAGIQVYFYDEESWKDYAVGDELILYGELKETKGELRLYVKDSVAIQKISSENKLNIHKTQTGKSLEENEGRLVVVTGEIVRTSGKTFYIDDGSGELKVLIKSSTGIETPKKKKGEYAGIVGILSQYGEDSDGNAIYRVLPRYSGDIVISSEPLSYGDVLAATGQDMLLFKILGIVLLLTISVSKLLVERLKIKVKY